MDIDGKTYIDWNVKENKKIYIGELTDLDEKDAFSPRRRTKRYVK